MVLGNEGYVVVVEVLVMVIIVVVVLVLVVFILVGLVVVMGWCLWVGVVGGGVRSL